MTLEGVLLWGCILGVEDEGKKRERVVLEV